MATTRCALLTAAAGLAAATAASSVQISLVSTAPISTTNPQYASWNIDSSCNRGFHQTNFSNPNLAAAGAGLKPSRLRFGGSGNDGLVYGLSPGSPECAGLPPVTPSNCSYTTPGCLNATHWDALYSFGEAAGADFMFGVSIGLQEACAQGPAYVWNSTNVAQLLAYLAAHNQTGNLWGFELGNEVNNNGPGTACNLQPVQQAAALATLQGMLASTLPQAKLIGPDTGYLDALQWLQEYLPQVKPGALYAITHHVYNGAKRTNFNTAQQLDSSLPEIAWYTNVTRSLYPSAQVWAGEDGPDGGGNDGTCGSTSICGVFASAIWYADDMGNRAKHGFAQYQRHDFFGGAYGLVNSPMGVMALGPSDPIILRPDYWVNFLWKRTVGTQVLNATSSMPTTRAYAFAGTPPSPFAAPQCMGSPLQLLLINIDNSSVASVSLPPEPTSTGGAAPATAGSAATGAGSSSSSATALRTTALTGNFAAWSLSSAPGQPYGPFTTISAINGGINPTTVDVSSPVNPSSFLSSITQPPVVGTVAGGITLSPLTVTYLCYY